MKDVTIGQYYQANSILHRLDPRVKLFATLLFLITVFVTNSAVGFIVVTSFLVGAVLMSKVPVKYMLKGLKGIMVLLIISVSFTILFTGGRIIWQLGIIKISREGLITGGKILLRLVYIVIASSIMTLTTTPNELTDGMEKAFSPLKKIKFPVHDIAMMMSIAFRFIPILMEEADKIMKAQVARGADFNEGNILKKAKAMVALVVPLIVSAMNRAIELATAMEARCYRGGDGRTKMKPLKYKRRDGIAYLVCLIYLGAIIAIKILMK